MGEWQVIRETLGRAAARRRLDRALRGWWYGLLAGCCAWLLILAAFKLFPIPAAVLTWAWVAPVAGGAIGLLCFAWRRIPMAGAARIVEARSNLDQRLSTALELSQTSADPASPWTRLVVADAAQAARGLDLRRLLPIRLPVIARWIPVALCLVVGLGFVPEYRSAAFRQRHKDAQAIRETGRKLAELIRHELAEHGTEAGSIRDALQDAGNLGDRLAQASLTRAEALKDLSNAAERLKEEAKQLESQPVLQKLQQAARSPSGSAGSGANSDLQKQLEKMQKSGGATPQGLDKLAQQLQQAQKMAAGMQGSQPDASAQQALAQALSQLSQDAGRMGLDVAGLNQALAALNELGIDRVLKDLAAAGTELDKLRDMARQMAQMQQSMEQAGKDLAEQLSRGQAEKAAETLEKMVEDLKASGLTPEQLSKLMAEVAKALKPAAEYGKVAELLKAGSEKMNAGASKDAAQQLAQAARELRELAKQSQDAQQLAETLQALQNAEAAIAAGRTWQPGQCQGGACAGCSIHPNGRPAFGKGGKPGRGVGTWAEENGWLYYPEISERWDNSGIDRPDMAARGQTDRGDGKLSGNVLPTKLQGQFSPGAMPSITLKGVSVVGQSTVQFQQAVDAAQSDAQSALNQDQVPRAYRGAVKGYFDDLK